MILIDPIAALEQWYQDEARNNGLVSCHFFIVPNEDGSMPDLTSAATQVMDLLTAPYEDRTGQVH